MILGNAPTRGSEFLSLESSYRVGGGGFLGMQNGNNSNKNNGSFSKSFTNYNSLEAPYIPLNPLNSGVNNANLQEYC